MFENILNSPEQVSVYPGNYEPLPGQVRELSDELASRKSGSALPVKISVGNEFYRVTLLAPGFRREEFFINTRDRTLSITGMRKNASTPNNLSKELRSSQAQCIQQDVLLPPDVDTEFVTAEYANGTLSIWIFRTKTPVINKPVRIIVH